MLRYLAIVAFALSGSPAQAHGGGLDANGCHTNRKTGDYHCHRGPVGMPKPAPEAATPRSLLGTGGAFANCAAARAAGAAPVGRGEPGYGTHLDRDNDGVGCE